MSTLLLSDLARENADSNHRVAQAVEMAAERVVTLGQVQEKLPISRVKVIEDCRAALRYTLRQSDEVCSLWRGAMAYLRRGLEGDEARALLDVVVEAFDSWFGLVKSTRDLWQKARLATVVPEMLQELDKACSQVEQSRKHALEGRDFLNRPRPPVDPALLETARQEVAQGRYSNANAVSARMK
jgi:hypothetical protein